MPRRTTTSTQLARVLLRRSLSPRLVTACALAVTLTALLPAPPASACTAAVSPGHPSSYCEMPRPVGWVPPSQPPATECRLEMVTWDRPAYPATDFGTEFEDRQAVDVFSIPHSTVTLTGYERPSTTVRHLGTATTNVDGYAGIPLQIRGSTRLFLTSDAAVCDGQSATKVALVQARLGTLTAHRNGTRDYSFSAFYAGPDGKIGSLYRVLADGSEVLTAQTRMGGEWASVRRVFTGSGRFGFVLRSGDDINSLGTSSTVRDTVIH